MEISHGDDLQVDGVETWDVTGQGLEGWEDGGEKGKRPEEVSIGLFLWGGH